jgi:hypothetical protein
MNKKEAHPFPFNLEEQLIEWKHKIELEQLGLPKVKKKFKKKFIILQIDALPFYMVEKYLNRPCLKFIRSLITDKHYYISRYNCSIPSDTPTVLAGMLYGNSDQVIGFRSADKRRRKIMTFANPYVAQETEQRLKKKKGILTEGSAFVSMYSGGAKRTFLTMSTLASKRGIRRLKESNIIVLMLLNPLVLLRVIYYSVIEFFLELYDTLRSFLHRVFVVREKKASFKLIHPFRRFIYQGIVMELQRIGAVLDMKRGVPRIYLNFHAYDDVLHRRGIESKAALRVLKQIDETIRKIHRHTPKDYDIYVMSDHGAEDSVPFDHAYDEPLAAFLRRLTKVEVQESKGEEGLEEQARRSAEKISFASRYLTGPPKWVLKTLVKILSKSAREKEREAVWKDKEQIFIQNAGSLGHIYFNISAKRLGYKEIKRHYPKVLPGLQSHPGIGVIVVNDGNNTRIIGWDGEFIVSNKKPRGKLKIVSKKGKDFLKRFGETKTLLEQIRRLSNRKNVGDIILFGNYHYGKMVAFGNYYAAHGGIGRRTCSPFFMSKQGFDLREVTDPDKLYDIFKSYL